MRASIRKIIAALLQCYPYNLYLRGKQRLMGIYSLWISNALKSAGPGFRVARPVYLTGGKYITIGDNVNCNHYCHIISAGRVSIGNNVLLGSNVYISDRSHGDATRDSTGVPAHAAPPDQQRVRSDRRQRMDRPECRYPIRRDHRTRQHYRYQLRRERRHSAG